MSLQALREKYPEYNDLPDEVLAKGFHKKYYSDIPYDQYEEKMGLGRFLPPPEGFIDNLRFLDLPSFNKLMGDEGLLGNLSKIAGRWIWNSPGMRKSREKEEQARQEHGVPPINWDDSYVKQKEEKKQAFINKQLEPYMETIALLERQDKTETPEYKEAWKLYEKERAVLEQMGKTPEFSMTGLWQGIKEDPGRFGAEFLNALVADPELMLTPLGWTRAAAVATAKLGRASFNVWKAVGPATTKFMGPQTIAKTGGVVAGAGGAAVTGGGLLTAISAAEQYEQTGEIDPIRLREEGIMGAAASVLFVGLFRGASKAFRRIPEKEIAEAVKKNVLEVFQKGKTLTFEGITRQIGKDLGIESPHADIDFRFHAGKEMAENVLGEQSSRALKLMDDAARFTRKDPVKAKTKPTPYNAKAKAQAGFVTPKMITLLGVPAAGYLIGGAIDGEDGATAGAILAAGGLLSAKAIIKTTGLIRKGLRKSMVEPIRVDRLADRYDGELAVGTMRSYQLMTRIRDMVPKLERREAITHWLEGDKTQKLTPSELIAANMVRKVLDDFHAFLKKEGVLEAFLENYVPHFWRQGRGTKEALRAAILGARKPGPGMAMKTPHAKRRTLETYQIGTEKGFKPITLDIADVLKMYLDDVYRVVLNRRLVNALKKETDMEGRKLFIPEGKAPKDYVAIDHPSLRGVKWATGEDGIKTRFIVRMRAHPDIADHMKFIIEHSDPGIIKRGLLSLNFASKRSLVGMSFFHANALVESMIFANMRLKDPSTWIEPVLTVADVATSFIPGKIPHISKTFKTADLLASGKANDIIETALKAGLKIGSIEDVGLKYAYSFFNGIGEGIVALTPTKLGKGVSQTGINAIAKLTRKIDEVMWDKIMTGGKLSVFMREYERALLKNAKLHAKNPKKYALVDERVLGQEIAEYVNDAFGGLNWRQMAQSARTHLGRTVLNQTYSAAGRQSLQLGLFAPDWCCPATTRAMTKTGWKYHHELKVGEEILTFNPDSHSYQWDRLEDKYFNPQYSGKLIKVKNRNRYIEMTPDHTCYVWNTSKRKYETVKAKNLNTAHRILRCANFNLTDKQIFDDRFVKLVGWLVTDGYIKRSVKKLVGGGDIEYLYGRIVQSKPDMVKVLKELDLNYHIDTHNSDHGAFKANYVRHVFNIPCEIFNQMVEEGLDAGLNWEFLEKLPRRQLEILYDTMMLGDGTGQNRFCGKEKEVFFMTLIQTMLGEASTFYQQEENCWRTRAIKSKGVTCEHGVQEVDYEGLVWCPSVKTGFWVAENDGMVFITGNTIANVRVMLRAVPGVARSARQTKLHMWYATRATMFYLLGGSLLNMYFTGKPIWENEDITRVDMGDGRTMQFSKQYIEPIHWVDDPWKTAANKLGIIPRTFYELLSNQRWVSPYGAPPIWKEDDPWEVVQLKRLRHITAGKFIPISAQQTMEHGWQGLAGFFGHPIYGKVKGSPAEERRKRRKRRRELARKRRLERYESR